MRGKALNSREATKELNSDGFRLIRQSGDHLIFMREPHERIVITHGKRFSQKTYYRERKKVGLRIN